MKKILFLITTLNNGGAEKTLIDIANLLPEDKFDITIQTLIDEGVNKTRIKRNIKYKTIIKSRNKLIRKIKIKLIHKVINPKYIYTHYIKNDYDIEVAFLEGITTRIISYSLSKNSKKIAWVHTDLNGMFGSVNVYRNLEENRKCYGKFDRIACVSDAVRKSFIKKIGDYGNKLQTVYNLIPRNDILLKGQEEIGIYNHDYPIMVSCGSFTEQKGFDRLLRIHKKLIEEGIPNYLWLVGDGVLRRKYEKYIVDNGIYETVKILGFQENPYKYMSKADLFVCSSLIEGYSLVISEAVSLGIPVISTNVAGVDEPKDCPRCYAIVDNNEESLYQEIKKIFVNPKDFIKAKKITSNYSLHFDQEAQLDKIIDFLEEESVKINSNLKH